MNPSKHSFLFLSFAFLIETIMCGGLIVLYESSSRAQDRKQKEASIALLVDALNKEVYELGVAIASYSITKSPFFSDRYQKIANKLPMTFEELKGAVDGDAEKVAAVNSIGKLIQDYLLSSKEEKASIDENKPQFRARHMYKTSTILAMQITERTRALIAERRLYRDAADPTKSFKMALNVVTALNGFFLVAMLALAFSLKKSDPQTL